MEIGQIGHEDHFVKYSENGKVLFLNGYFPSPLPDDYELLAKIPMIVELPRHFTWSGPKKEVIPDVERRQVIDNLQRTLEAMEVRFRFQDVAQ